MKIRDYILEATAEDIIKYYPTIPEDDILQVVSADPTSLKNPDDSVRKVGEYARWILDLVRRNSFRLEDLDRATSALIIYHKVKPKLDTHARNVYNFHSLQDLEDAVEPYQTDTHGATSIADYDKASKDSEVTKFFENSKWLVVIPKTEESSCRYGRGTRWCTAATETTNRFNEYNDKGPLYIIINKHDPEEKYQLHFETGQFMDVDDRPIELEYIFKTIPELKEKLMPKIMDGILANSKDTSVKKTYIKDNKLFYELKDLEALADGFVKNQVETAARALRGDYFDIDIGRTSIDDIFNYYDPSDKVVAAIEKHLTKESATWQDDYDDYKDALKNDDTFYDVSEAVKRAYSMASESQYQTSVVNGVTKAIDKSNYFSILENIWETQTVFINVIGHLDLFIQALANGNTTLEGMFEAIKEYDEPAFDLNEPYNGFDSSPTDKDLDEVILDQLGELE
jgi:hypothetical protein